MYYAVEIFKDNQWCDPLSLGSLIVAKETAQRASKFFGCKFRVWNFQTNFVEFLTDGS